MDDLKPTQCWACDFGSGHRGMDRCTKCDGAGSLFWVAGHAFSNTEEGYKGALEAKKKAVILPVILLI